MTSNLSLLIESRILNGRFEYITTVTRSTYYPLYSIVFINLPPFFGSSDFSSFVEHLIVQQGNSTFSPV